MTEALRVFLMAPDLFSTVGGGQAFYRYLIHSTPDVLFYFPAFKDVAAETLPANARPVRCLAQHEDLFAAAQKKGADLSVADRYDRLLLSQYMNVALALRDAHFDIIDVPDFEPHLRLFLSALDLHGCTYRKVALSLHGKISRTLRLNLPTTFGPAAQRQVEKIEKGEREIFNRADIVYSISHTYSAECSEVFGRTVEYVSPLTFFPIEAASQQAASGLPDVYFLGRKDHFKGPDIFVDLVWRLPRASYTSAIMHGSEVTLDDRIPSSELIRRCAEQRSVDIISLGSASAAEMKSIFESRSVAVFPSRWDTLNFTCMEAIFAGCPVLVSNHAGVVEFLRREAPGIPFASFDLSDIGDGAEKLRDLLVNYDEHRASLNKALASFKPARGGKTVGDVYRSALAVAEAPRQPDSEELEAILDLCIGGTLDYANLVWERRSLGRIATVAKTRPEQRRGDGRFHDALTRLRRDLRFVAQSEQILATDAAAATYKLGVLKTHLDGSTLGRFRLYREMAKLELLKDEKMNAATYLARIARAGGKMSRHEMETLTGLLAGIGMVDESSAVRALHEESSQAKALIERSVEKLNTVPKQHAVQVTKFFGRENTAPRISVIVSLYAAAGKLRRFMEDMDRQTAVRAGLVEFVFIDANSPTQEQEIIADIASRTAYPIRYIRTKERITIQAAWNVGIQAARGEYLSFLGVDESLVPHALEKLADELSRHSRVDWVQGGALVTEVDQHGAFLKDLMLYDRGQAVSAHHMLDCTYVSYVGGMYRASIHERLGYYDETYRGAGDTEFKNRVLGKLCVRTIPPVLGIYLNYPDDRTTQSSRVELEDLRAWYLYRTPGGIAYMTSQMDMLAIAQAARSAGRHRKCYFRDERWDVELAALLTDELARRVQAAHSDVPIEDEVASTLLLGPGFHQLHRAYRGLDALFDSRTRINAGGEAVVWDRALDPLLSIERVEAQHAEILDFERIDYDYTRDNRRVQHHGAW